MAITGSSKHRIVKKSMKTQYERRARESMHGVINGFRALFVLHWKGILIAGLAVLIQLPGSLAGLPDWQAGGPAQSGLALVVGLLAASGLARAARAQAGQPVRVRLAWAAFTAAAAAFSLARAAGLAGQALAGGGFPAGRLFGGLFSALFLAGVLLHPVCRGPRRGLAPLSDTLIVLLSSVFITWQYFLLPMFSAAVDSGGPSEPLARLMQMAVPVGDLLVLWGVILLWMRSYPLRFQPSMRLLMAAGVAAILANGFDTGLLAGSILYAPVWPALLQLISASLLMMAGMILYKTSASQGLPATRLIRNMAAFEALRRGAPVIWIGVVFALLQITPYQHSFWNRIIFPVWMGCIVTLMIARQLAELGYTRHLEIELEELKASLEKQVEERTAELVRANQELRQEMSERAHIEQILREREEAMEFTAMHDALTGLPNRLLLMEHLHQAIRKIQRWDRYDFALLFLDFDGFKAVNDRLGHPFGDKVLVAVSQRLRQYVRQADTVARLGGDEFIVLLQGVRVVDGVYCPAVERLREIICEPYLIDGKRVTLSVSIGVVIGDKSYQQPADFLRDADLAMYEAKARGKGRYVLFNAEMRRDALDRLVLEDDLRGALGRDELILYYHPVLSLETHRITGFEALVRWKHPKRGMLPPDVFIPIAETSHQILPITRFLLLKACSQIRRWQAGHPDDNGLTISLNISSALFVQPGALEMVEEILVETGLPARFLKLEINESAMGHDNETILSILKAWHELGVQVLMDDFGTGYASLSYLHRFPVDALKIDRSFIQSIQPNGEQGRLARTVITLARELNLEVIAEGVETVDQLAFLESLGCQYAQGYLISHPLPAGEVKTFLRAYPALAASWFDTGLVMPPKKAATGSLGGEPKGAVW